MLLPDNQLQTTLTKRSLSIRARLGEGGQGQVFLVTDGDDEYALKWYFAHQATDAQRKAIRDLVQTGPPRRPAEAGERFIWPLDIVTAAGLDEFGYLMGLVDMQRFAELGEVQARLKPQPSPRAMCEISYQLANSYRALHLAGLCYRDISRGNMMFDPVAGDVLICDNDNVGVATQSKCQVLGTWEFMAPEVILGLADPSTSTDLHSLAVLLFELWMWHHPMHGDLECAIRSWDIPAKKRVYGENPVFVFDPVDSSNRPNDPDYRTVRKRWELCPKSLRTAFESAFTTGLKEPAKRVTEGQWQQLFLQLKELLVRCPACGVEVFCEPSEAATVCGHCRTAVPVPVRLEIDTGAGNFYLLLTSTTELARFHMRPSSGRSDNEEVLGRMVQNPNNPGQFGIRNLTATAWKVRYVDGSTSEVPPQKAVPLTANAEVLIEEHWARIVS